MVPRPLRKSGEKQFMKIGHEYFSNPPVKFHETSLFSINSHATKKFTPHITSWSCRTKGIDFANLSRDRVTHEYWVDCL